MHAHAHHSHIPRSDRERDAEDVRAQVHSGSALVRRRIGHNPSERNGRRIMGEEIMVAQLSTEGKVSSTKKYEPPTIAFETVFKDLHVSDFDLQKQADFSSTIAQALTVSLAMVNFMFLPAS